MLLEHEGYYGLGMGALVTACSRNTNVLMVWAWMLQLPYALGTQTLLWFGHGCYSAGMLLEHERYYGLGMDAPVTVCSWNTNVIMVGHGCSHHRVLCNTNVILVWAWMLQLPYAL